MTTRGRRTALHLTLTHAEWQALQATQQRDLLQPEPPLSRHARMVLLCARGVPITTIAQAVGMSRVHTYKWFQRWQAEGMAD